MDANTQTQERPVDGRPLGDPLKARFVGQLDGRYLLTHWGRRKPCFCRIRSIGCDSMTFIGMAGGKQGEEVSVGIPDLGIVRGRITRTIGAQIAMRIDIPNEEKFEFAKKISWLDRKSTFSVRDRRNDNRFQLEDPRARIILDDGRMRDCMIIDISATGAAIAMDETLPIGTIVALGTLPGKVVRHTELGFAIRFYVKQDPNKLDRAVKADHLEDLNNYFLV